MLEFTHKDAFRDWWKITLKKGRIDKNKIDYWWTYTLLKENDCTGKYEKVFTGKILGQSDSIPMISDVMRDISHKVISLSLSFSCQYS